MYLSVDSCVLTRDWTCTLGIWEDTLTNGATGQGESTDSKLSRLSVFEAWFCYLLALCDDLGHMPQLFLYELSFLNFWQGYWTLSGELFWESWWNRTGFKNDSLVIKEENRWALKMEMVTETLWKDDQWRT